MKHLYRAYLLLIASIFLISFLLILGNQYGLYVPLTFVGMNGLLVSVILAFKGSG